MTTDKAALHDRLLAAGARWEQRTAERTQHKVKLDHGGPQAAESPSRLREHKRYQRAIIDNPPLATVERVIGSADFTDAPPTPEAGIAARPVARLVEAAQSGFEARGFGTGFMVAPGILLTNNHVIADQGLLSGILANFGYTRVGGRIATGSVHELSARAEDFITDRDLDFTLIGLKRDPGLGFHSLIGMTGKILLGEPISIIQHPRGGTQQFASTNNTLVDLLPDFLHYTTDTEPGSSGSPGFNRDWHVVTLHHQGVPLMQGRNILKKDKVSVWDPDKDNEDDIAWVANEGVRISRILDRLREIRASDPKLAPFIDRVLAPTQAHKATTMVDRIATGETAGTALGVADTATVIHIHAPTVIYTSASRQTEITTSQALTPDRQGATFGAPEAIAIDSDYRLRKGYDANFLGDGSPIALPELSAAMAKQVAPLSDGDAAGVLRYHHFSIVMHAERGIALYTAVNIDGKRGRRPARESDRWIFDPRIARRYQRGEALYADNPLDRGHLVRRLDPAWGTLKQAKLANDDTFHFSNCSPQHVCLNQQIWADLEDYLLDNAQEDDQRLTVFTGPVFAADDPTYRDVQLPRRFWKVAVMRRDDGRLLAAGFVQSQRKWLASLKEADFLNQQTRVDQCKVAQIEALAGLSFPLPAGVDALAGEPEVALAESQGLTGRALQSLEDIKL